MKKMSNNELPKTKQQTSKKKTLTQYVINGQPTEQNQTKKIKHANNNSGDVSQGGPRNSDGWACKYVSIYRLSNLFIIS